MTKKQVVITIDDDDARAVGTLLYGLARARRRMDSESDRDRFERVALALTEPRETTGDAVACLACARAAATASDVPAGPPLSDTFVSSMIGAGIGAFAAGLVNRSPSPDLTKALAAMTVARDRACAIASECNADTGVLEGREDQEVIDRRQAEIVELREVGLHSGPLAKQEIIASGIPDSSFVVAISMRYDQWHAICYGVGASVSRDHDIVLRDINGVSVQRAWWHLQGMIRNADVPHQPIGSDGATR